MATALPRFNGRTALIDFSGVPSYAFHLWWDKVASTVESNIDSLATQLADIQAAQAAADAAQTSADTAQTTADSKARVTRAATAPASPATNDVWVDTSVSPVVVKVWDGAVWQQSARNTTNTSEVTDGAGLGTTALWSGVTGTGKPDDNATVGANWATNLTNRPTELTDGRVSAGLTSTGDLNRNITTTRANSSNLLRRTSGGLYTGDLTATEGATIGPGGNVTGSVDANGRALIDFSQAGHTSKNLDNISDGSTYARINASQLSSGNHKLTVAGSGTTIGDQRNLPPITGAGGRYKFTGAITYTSTTTTATISVAAGSLIVGNNTISYNAMSANVTGSGTITYYLYVNANQFTAGAHTLNTTTTGNDIYSSDANVYIGTVDVTYTTSGSGGGSGGGGLLGCPWAEAWVHTRRGWIKAKDVVPGDEVLVLSEDRLKAEEYEIVTSNRATEEHCHVIYGVITGVKVTVSDSTPITLRDGSLISVKDINAHALPFEEDGVLWWEPCKILPAGVLPVHHIKCNNKTYSAGDVSGKGILTHNPKP